MKQKIHISFYTEASLRVAERIEKSASHFQIPKLINFQILLFCILYSLFSISVNAQQSQPYEWKWAMNGGGRWGGLGGGG
ncbi:hypothetical protein [Myroides indicus]|uniref:Uncharacterized protein n=1 Tax=Myroides indicus TaxID=1323422 RepID=A0A4V3E7Q2_9FLAO|nr:hypothetical protein [Myroides indicus]TDS49822.1 hypothetical protein C8P70_1712 [Myroides indicus]